MQGGAAMQLVLGSRPTSSCRTVSFMWHRVAGMSVGGKGRERGDVIGESSIRVGLFYIRIMYMPERDAALLSPILLRFIEVSPQPLPLCTFHVLLPALTCCN